MLNYKCWVKASLSIFSYYIFHKHSAYILTHVFDKNTKWLESVLPMTWLFKMLECYSKEAYDSSLIIDKLLLVLTLPHLEQFHSPHHLELKRDWRQVCKHNRIKWTGTNNWEHHSWLVVRAQWFTLNYHLPVACEQALIIGVFAWASLPPPPSKILSLEHP